MSWTTPTTRATGDLITASIWNADIPSNWLAALPLGAYLYQMLPTAGYEVANVINGMWAECNHQAISRSTYAAFDTKVAALTPARPFGAGNGTTTVNVPDFFGAMPWAMGSNAACDAFGDNNLPAAANRRAEHKHTPHHHSNGFGAAAQTSTGSSNYNSATGQITGDSDGGSGISTDALDAPAYQVGGIWTVKIVT